MKNIILIAIAFMIGCASTVSNPTVPSGYKACHSDMDCPPGQFCGFMHVDTYAVCRN
jgi:hypothetical protein